MGMGKVQGKGQRWDVEKSHCCQPCFSVHLLLEPRLPHIPGGCHKEILHCSTQNTSPVSLCTHVVLAHCLKNPGTYIWILVFTFSQMVMWPSVSYPNLWAWILCVCSCRQTSWYLKSFICEVPKFWGKRKAGTWPWKAVNQNVHFFR
jgi:hypothetical protein